VTRDGERSSSTFNRLRTIRKCPSEASVVGGVRRRDESIRRRFKTFFFKMIGEGGTGSGATARSRDERAATREREVTRFALRPRDDRARIRLDVERRDRVFEGSDGEGHESKFISRLLHRRSRVFVTSRRIGVFQHPPRRRSAVRREPRFFPGRLLRLLFRGTSRASLSVHTFTLFQRCERNHRTHPALFWTASIFEFPARRPRESAYESSSISASGESDASASRRRRSRARRLSSSRGTGDGAASIKGRRL